MTTASRAIRAVLRRPGTDFVCHNCQAKSVRRITQNHLARLARGKEKWAANGLRIRAGAVKSIIANLEERGLVHDFVGERNDVDNLLIDKRVAVYAGVDPTAPSLHIGNLVPLMCVFWFFIYGCQGVTLIGGSTASIGDPTGRSADREAMTSTERKANIAAIHYQVKKIWQNVERLGKHYEYDIDEHVRRDLTNNGVWWNTVPMLEVLKLLGKHTRMGTMLSRETSGGMSFAEFCYPLMQSWDFYRMYSEKGVQIQVGGQDQFGNILSGVEAIKSIVKNHPSPEVRPPEGKIDRLDLPYGITTPLLTSPKGEKMGKSAGNALWLDSQILPSFDLYSYFMRLPDDQVEQYLKFFTFKPLAEIAKLMELHQKDPSLRHAHHALAFDFLCLVESRPVAKELQQKHKQLFKKGATLSDFLQTTDEVAPMSPSAPEPAPENPLTNHQAPNKRLEATFINSAVNKYAKKASSETQNGPVRIVLPKSMVFQQPISRVLYGAGLASSRSEGHRIADQGGAYLGHRSGITANHGKTQMSDDLSFTPAKLHDKNQTWRFVIRDHLTDHRISPEGGAMDRAGEEGILIIRIGKWKLRIIRIVSDELFAKLKLPDPPGYREMIAEKIVARNAGDMEEPYSTPRLTGKQKMQNVTQQQAQASEFLQKRGIDKAALATAGRWQTWIRGKRAESESTDDSTREAKPDERHAGRAAFEDQNLADMPAPSGPLRYIRRPIRPTSEE